MEQATLPALGDSFMDPPQRQRIWPAAVPEVAMPGIVAIGFERRGDYFSFQ